MDIYCLYVRLVYFFFFFILQVLIRHQFYTHQCIHVNPNRPIQHTTIPTSPNLSAPRVSTLMSQSAVGLDMVNPGCITAPERIL